MCFNFATEGKKCVSNMSEHWEWKPAIHCKLIIWTGNCKHFMYHIISSHATFDQLVAKETRTFSQNT